MISKLKLYLGMAVAFAIPIIFFWGQSQGRLLERAKAEAKKVKDAQTAQQSRTEARSMGDDELDEEVERWQRRD